MTTSQTIVVTVDESVTYKLRIPADVLIEHATAAGYAPTVAGAQEWIAMGGLDPDDQLITDDLTNAVVNERIVDPETTVEDDQ